MNLLKSKHYTHHQALENALDMSAKSALGVSVRLK